MPQTDGNGEPVAEAAGPERHAALVERLYRQLERQMLEIEDRKVGEAGEATASDFERQARTLSSMVRVLDRLAELKRASAAPLDGGGQEQDADRLRRDIAQRLVRLRAGSQD